ncbi:LysR family transcriptional regulator [Neptuniibacter sp. QD34_54]|uniref:LysR family transcriptional regulator n=1 Tax=unclassified Neptuniibacter TaxID=2630693 RepID=UPI0039F5CCD1
MLELLRIFIQVASYGSFSKTAKALNIAPSSVTRSIDKLEAELGVSLFKRSTRALSLTEHGQQLFERANLLLKNADDLVSSVKDANAEPKGELKISVFESFGRQKVSPLIPLFLKQFPKVNVQIELDNQLVDLNSSAFDIGIRIGKPEDSDLRARKLLENRMVLCASPNYLDVFGSPSEPSDLSDHNCLLLNQGRQRCYWHFNSKLSSEKNSLQSSFKKYKKVLVTGNLSSKGGSPLVEAAIAGTGILLIARWVVEDHLNDGSLIECMPEWTPSLYEQGSGDIYAIYQGSRYLKPSVRSFIDFLVEHISD